MNIPDQYIELRYENFRNNPHSELSRIFDRLNIKIDAAELDNIISKNSIDRMKTESENLKAITSPNQSEVSNPIFPDEFIGSGSSNSKDFGLSYWHK